MAEESGTWTTFDVLKGILALMPEERLPADTPLMHGAVCRLRENPDFARFLREYAFERRSYFPYCHTLETDLGNLEISGHLATPNPILREYERTEKLKITFRKHNTSRFSKAELETLKKMAQQFSEAVHTTQ